MRTPLLAAVLLLIAMAVMTTVTYGSVNAVGTPTDNFTLPDPGNDPSHDEIKPQVSFTLQAPTAQMKTTPPYFTTDFIVPAAETPLTVTGNGKWNLDIDINTPGYLYIYEYYPPGNTPSGNWLAYKWQLKQSGIWRLGPLDAGENGQEGQHVYRLWFYSNGQWASVDAKHSLIYWVYFKDFPELKINSFTATPAEIKAGEEVTVSWDVRGARNIEISMIGPVSGEAGSIVVTPEHTTDYNLLATGLDGRQVQSGAVTVAVKPAGNDAPAASPTEPALPPKQTSFPDELQKFITNPLGLLATLISLSILSLLIFLVIKVYRKRKQLEEEPEAVKVTTTPVEPEERTPAPLRQQPEEVRARLSLPGGLEIRVAGEMKNVGRADLARSLSLDALATISQKQFVITSENGDFFIEDADSTNGTTLNGIDIRGKGPFVLKNEDTIEPSGAVQIKFFITSIN